MLTNYLTLRGQSHQNDAANGHVHGHGFDSHRDHGGAHDESQAHRASSPPPRPIPRATSFPLSHTHDYHGDVNIDGDDGHPRDPNSDPYIIRR